MGTLKKIEKKLTKREYVPVHEDPIDELRLLVKRHRALTKSAVRVSNMSSDRKHRETGETIKCELPLDVREAYEAAAKHAKHEAQLLKTPMRRNLKQTPIYEHFLGEVWGCGELAAAYLAASVDIHKATKPSNLRRYCGLARIDGKLERRRKDGGPKASGGTGTYNAVIRTQLYTMFVAMAKNRARHAKTNKYLDIWDGYRTRFEAQEKKSAYQAAMWRMGDVFIEDLYTIWRTLEGLPVWPSWYAVHLGYKHGGKVCVNEPRLLTLDEAKELVGHVGAIPYAIPEAAE